MNERLLTLGSLYKIALSIIAITTAAQIDDRMLYGIKRSGV